MEKTCLIILLFTLILAVWYPSPVSAQNIDPQYIFVRKDNTCTDCFNWGGADPNQINIDSINEIFGSIGTKGTDKRKLGIGVLFFYNLVPLESLKLSLNRLLTYSQIHDFPVFIVLDGFEWWDSRPDLWNWWDPVQPGYNPNNINNVEWTCWNSSCAVKKSWRNWGAEMEVKPHPNISSPAFIEANKTSLRQLVPIISNWYHNLPDDQKYLFGGFSNFNEQDIGANYYYYINGIPTGKGIQDSIQLGYSAVKTAGLKTSGNLTISDLDEVVRRYQTALNKETYDLGIPRDKIFNHNGTKDANPPWLSALNPNLFPSAEASLNDFAHPGWSFYDTAADNPQNLPGLNIVFNQIGNTQWAVPEWRTFTKDYNGWITGLRNTLNLKNIKFLNIANWDGNAGVKNKPYALDAIRTVLSESRSCWVTAPTANITINGNSLNITWQNGENNNATYLNISDNSNLNVQGLFQNINITNVNVTNQNSFQQSNLIPGKYYFLFAADGCSPVQRRISYGSFTVNPSPTTPSATPTPIDFNTFLNLFKSYYNQPNPPASVDLNNNGIIEIFDYNRFLSK